MKKIVTILVFVGLVLSSSLVFAGGECLSDPNTRKNYYNGRRQGDNLTNYNNYMRMQNGNDSSPEWVRRQEQQNFRLHQFKRQHSDFTERHWESD